MGSLTRRLSFGSSAFSSPMPVVSSGRVVLSITPVVLGTRMAGSSRNPSKLQQTFVRKEHVTKQERLRRLGGGVKMKKVRFAKVRHVFKFL